MTEIAKEYGTALFSLAMEEGKTEEYAEALRTVLGIFEQNPEYLSLLSGPSIPLGERLSSLREVFASALPVHVLSYLSLLCEKGRISCFGESAEEYFALLNASRNRSNAVVTSAVSLTDGEKDQLRRKLEALRGGTVQMTFSVDPSLLGGVVVEMDGKVLDGSLRHRLREVKEVMSV